MDIKEVIAGMAIGETKEVVLYTLKFNGLYGRNRKSKWTTLQAYSKEELFRKFNAIKPKHGVGKYYTKRAELTKREGYEIVSQGLYDNNGDTKQFNVNDGVYSE